jgi:hypothetical protein
MINIMRNFEEILNFEQLMKLTVKRLACFYIFTT